MCFIITYVIYKILLNFMKFWMEIRNFELQANLFHEKERTLFHISFQQITISNLKQ